MESVDPNLVDQWQLPDVNNNQKKSPNKAVIIIGVVVAALLVLGIGVYAGSMLGSDGSQQPVAATSEQQRVGSSNSFNLQANEPEPEPATVTVVETEVVTQTPSAAPAQGQARSSTSGGIQCDGRGVLIVYSVVDTGQNVTAEANNVMAKYPGSKMLSPGACSSLRASVDGNDVYAIVIDYGHDTSSLCSAAASLGGNPRTMNNRGDFSDPCG